MADSRFDGENVNNVPGKTVIQDSKEPLKNYRSCQNNLKGNLKRFPLAKYGGI